MWGQRLVGTCGQMPFRVVFSIFYCLAAGLGWSEPWYRFQTMVTAPRGSYSGAWGSRLPRGHSSCIKSRCSRPLWEASEKGARRPRVYPFYIFVDSQEYGGFVFANGLLLYWVFHRRSAKVYDDFVSRVSRYSTLFVSVVIMIENVLSGWVPGS